MSIGGGAIPWPERTRQSLMVLSLVESNKRLPLVWFTHLTCADNSHSLSRFPCACGALPEHQKVLQAANFASAR